MTFHAERISFVPHGGDRREAMFRESAFERVERWALSLAWATSPKRVAGLPGLLRMVARETLAPDYALPDAERALASPPGLAGIAHDLSLPIRYVGVGEGIDDLLPFNAEEYADALFREKW